MKRIKVLILGFIGAVVFQQGSYLRADGILSRIASSPLTLPILHSLTYSVSPLSLVDRIRNLGERGHIRLESDESGRPLRMAFLGDSLSRDFQIRDPLQFVWDSHLHLNGGAMIENSDGGVLSVAERLSQFTSIEAWNFARNNAEFNDHEKSLKAPFTYNGIVSRLSNEQSFSDQVTSLIQLKAIPDLIVIWLGHNDANWLVNTVSIESLKAGTAAPVIAAPLAQGLSRLYRYLLSKNSRAAVVVFGPLVGFSFKELRERLRHTPTFQRATALFSGYSDEKFETFSLLLEKMHPEIREIVDQFNEQVAAWPSVRFFYSDIFRYVTLSDPSVVSVYDGIHPTAKGQNIIAGHIEKGLRPALQWLRPELIPKIEWTQSSPARGL